MFPSAASMALQIREKTLTSAAAVTQCLEQIEQINPRINAVVTLADHALEQALQADERLAKGEIDGPLHGVPMTIKDCFDTEGMVSTWGTLGRKDFIPNKDATVVKRLKAAGAILLGKTNTPELTLNFSTYNKIHGFTKNPYDLTRSPGGSSGGAAAAIACGLTAFDIGTDFGGSIRVPSHFCGTVGIKPTSGSVPRTGLCLPPGMLMDFMSHVGPMARYVEDLKLILPIIWGPDSIDTSIVGVPFPDPDSVNLPKLRCLVMVDNGISEPDEETRTAVNVTADLLAEAGLPVCHDRLNGVSETSQLAGRYWALGGIAAVRHQLNTAGTKPEDIANNWLRELDPQKVSADEYREWQKQSDHISGTVLTKHLLEIENFKSRMLHHMSQYDILISPVNAHSAPLLPQPGEHPFHPGDASYTEAFNLTGWPSGVIRCGTSKTGMPIGVQITANPWREDIVLAVMSYLESTLPSFAPPAILTD